MSCVYRYCRLATRAELRDYVFCLSLFEARPEKGREDKKSTPMI